MAKQKLQSQYKKPKMPKGWREDSNAVPLPFSVPWEECKHSPGVGEVGSLDLAVEQVGLKYLLDRLVDMCEEQCHLYGDGCPPVFPQDDNVAASWAYFGQRFRDMSRVVATFHPKK